MTNESPDYTLADLRVRAQLALQRGLIEFPDNMMKQDPKERRQWQNAALNNLFALNEGVAALHRQLPSKAGPVSDRYAPQFKWQVESITGDAMLTAPHSAAKAIEATLKAHFPSYSENINLRSSTDGNSIVEITSDVLGKEGALHEACLLGPKFSKAIRETAAQLQR